MAGSPSDLKVTSKCKWVGEPGYILAAADTVKRLMVCRKPVKTVVFTAAVIHILGGANKGNMLMVPQTLLSIMITSPLTICRVSTNTNTNTNIICQIQKIQAKIQIQTKIKQI